MKTPLRALALSLVVTGAFATAHINKNEATPRLDVASGAMPVPMCPPDAPDACNIQVLGK